MRPVSEAFKAIVGSSHTPKVRVRTVTGWPQSLAPTVTSTLPVVSGNVRMESSAIVRATADITYTDEWGGVLPGGVEAFIEYGVERDGGSTEWVSLGYFRFDTVTQNGYNSPITAQLSDRMAMVRDSNAVFNYVIPATESHAAAFAGLLYGAASATWGPDYGVFPPTALGQAIIFDYDAGSAKVGVDIPLLDTESHSFYDALQGIADSMGKRMFFDYLGRMNVVDAALTPEASGALRISGGPGGTLRSITRQATRNGVYNAVVAKGSKATEIDPPWWNSWNETGGSIDYFSPFGRVVRYVDSPVVNSNQEAYYVAHNTLSMSKGMIYTLSLRAVANPALEPLDCIAVVFPGQVPSLDGTPPPPGMYDEQLQIHIVDSLDFPLTGGEMSITTRSGFIGTL